MSGYYAANPHYAPTDLSEDRERRERCEREAATWFDDATGAQKASYLATLETIAPYRGAPRGERMRAAADRRWRDSTAEALALYEITLQELLRTGEVSEALAERWEALEAPAPMAEAAE